MRFASILCFTTLLTVVVVNDGWSDHLFYAIARWACIGFSVLLIKSGLHELFTRGLFAFLADSRNWVETYIAVASFVSLIGMELQARRETALDGDGAALTSEPMSGGGSAAGSGGDYAGTSGRLATMQAILMLLVWLRLAKWCGNVSLLPCHFHTENPPIICQDRLQTDKGKRNQKDVSSPQAARF